jgi:hypothetical protein
VEAAPDPLRQAFGRVGAYESWSRTVDRTARTRNARANAPGDVTYWLSKLGPEFDEASESSRLAAAEAAKSAYFGRLALKSAAARRAGGDHAA